MTTQSAHVVASNPVELFNSLAHLALRLDELQASSSDEPATAHLAGELTRIVQTALVDVGAIEQLDAVEPTPFIGERDAERETSVKVRIRPEPPRLGDVCFICRFELASALRRLEAAHDHDARLNAIDTARRKLRRAISAVAAVTPGHDAQLVRESLEQWFGAELGSAVAVRRLYAEFRNNLRRAKDDSNEAVLTALRYAASALATITASTHYRSLRVSDAALLRDQHARLLEWSRSGKPRAFGLQLLEDISTSADLLRDINRRQELRRHDAELIRTLLGPAPSDRATWLAHLDRLLGLDDALDRLIADFSTSQEATPPKDLTALLAFLA